MKSLMKKSVFTVTVLLSALLLPGLSSADIYIIPACYRAEVMTKNGTPEDIGTDIARIGGHYVGDDRYDFYTWAEFDITALKGKNITGAGLKVYNSWPGTRISGLRYCPIRVSSNMYQLYAQHRTQNLYTGFNWIISPNNAWTPADGTFYSPDWNNHKRTSGNMNTLIQDIQAHIDDSSKTWFSLEFSYFGTDRSNLCFAPPDGFNPASVILAVSTGGEFLDAKNFGFGCGDCGNRSDAGEPVNFSTGNEFHADEDFMLPGPGLPFGYTRHYNSRSTESSYPGYGWTGSYSEHLTVETERIILHEADGSEVWFDDDGAGAFVSEAYAKRVIQASGGGHILTEPDRRTLTFDSTGNLTQIRDRHGNTQTVVYSGGKPDYIEDNFGRRIEFAYSTDGFLQTMTTPAGIFTYTYDTHGNLAGVTKPDTKGKIYRYTDTDDPHNLTEAEDEKGAVYRLQYDSEDRATHSDFAGMSGVTIEYLDGMARRVTDSLGRVTDFGLEAKKGIGKVKTASGAGCGSCLTPSGGKYETDDRLRLTQSEDAEGNITEKTFDDRGNVLTKTEASGTPEERTFTYTWQPQYASVTSVTRESAANPGQNTVTSFTYDTTGNLRQKTETGYSGTTPVSRVTSFDYNTYGQITFIDGPRTDVSDTLMFEYYPNDASQGLNRGMLKKIVNGAGHETLFSQYNAWGKPRQVTDADSVVTDFVYDAMGRMKSKTAAGLATSYDYDNTGNLTAVHLPGGRDIVYVYTPANFLEKIEDDEGNYIKYSYDTEGNRLKEEIYDKNSVLKQFTDYEPDDFNRLKKIIYPGDAYEEYGYDGNNNLKQTRDAKGYVTGYDYDALDRLTAVTQPENRTTGCGYDRHDNLKTVTDPKNNVTSYGYDDFGRQTAAGSADTGSTAFQYDKADNVLSKTDANGITVTYQHDVLNRLTAIQFPDSSQNISFGYDSGTYGKGKLTSVTDPAGSTAYTYNAHGQLTQETRIADGHVYSTQYHYNPGTGELSGMTYPTGLNVTYQRDSSGRITGIAADGQSVTESVTYLPFGPVNGLTLGNDVLNISEEYDSRYFPTRIQAGSVLDYQYTHDAAGNVLTVSGIKKPSLSKGTTDYTYAVGNRLTQSTGAEAKTYSFDSNGNIISDGTRTFVYNQNNRLVRITEGAVTLGEYFYDAFGRRVKKVVSGIATVYHYDTAGNLIAETEAGGTPSNEVVYLNGGRVAMKLYGYQAGWYYFINDHLGTPHKIINEAGEVVWAGFYQPFGKAWAYPADITNNFRFPGQYYDTETGLHYNWNRYYDPDTGRYITADPIGLEGGVNLYAYVADNPVNMTDPTGEAWWLIFVAVYEAADLISSLYDAYTVAETVTDPDVSNLEKAKIVVIFAVTAGSPLPGGATGACRVGIKSAKSSFSFGKKIHKQIPKRGWDISSIDEVITRPHATSPATNKATGGRATAYFNRDGSYVIRDDATQEIIQVSNRNDANWIPDSSIVNPYHP